MPEEYAGKKVLVVATFGSNNPERCPAPFMFAGEAVKAGAEAGICFVLQAPLLLKQGAAENLRAKEGGRTIREFIDEALGLGVKFYVCDAALQLCNMTPEDLIEEIEELVGPSFLVKEGLMSDLVLSF
ncbi:MAG: DsrE family protein [Anaerolineales bacterium]|nr:DsrE family protein [Anaerolineales bacterium]